MIYVMYEFDHVLVIGFTTCMSMSMTTGRSHRSCLYLLYDLRVIEQRHVITLLYSKPLAIVVEVIIGEQLHADMMIEIMMMEIMVSCR